MNGNQTEHVLHRTDRQTFYETQSLVHSEKSRKKEGEEIEEEEEEEAGYGRTDACIEIASPAFCRRPLSTSSSSPAAAGQVSTHAYAYVEVEGTSR